MRQRMYNVRLLFSKDFTRATGKWSSQFTSRLEPIATERRRVTKQMGDMELNGQL